MHLTAEDKSCLAGDRGEATRLAMRFLVAAGEAMQASRLIDITRCHLVGSYYAGEADLLLLRRFAALGAKVRVPTTLNASSACLDSCSLNPQIDQEQAGLVVRLHEQLGCDPVLTCAPYHLPAPPVLGERIAWAESNAVTYANSVLGARSNKTVQYLDLCAALTGRIPEYGLYLDSARAPALVIDCASIPSPFWDEPMHWELLGLLLGYKCGSDIPLITGIDAEPTQDMLRSLSAAAASSGGMSMFHLAGITPEAPLARVSELQTTCVAALPLSTDDLLNELQPYAGSEGDAVSAICLGAPHYSLSQLSRLAKEVLSSAVRLKIPIYVTTSRYNLAQLQNTLQLGELRARGIVFLVDACSYYGQVIPKQTAGVMTDSAKWAYYAGGNLGVNAYLGSLENCIETARQGRLVRGDRS
jgi:predicted aconitase